MQKFKDYFDDNEDLRPGDTCKNINPDCKHFGSEGEVIEIKDINDNEHDNRIGKAVVYRVNNRGKEFNVGDILTKTLDQVIKR